MPYNFQKLKVKFLKQSNKKKAAEKSAANKFIKKDQ